MSGKLKFPRIKTTPLALGVCVEWVWPTPILGTSELEIQCLFDDGRLQKEKIKFPLDAFLIRGLKAGECVQIRLRAIAEDGSTDEWDAHHWIKGYASREAAECIYPIQGEISTVSSISAKQALELPKRSLISEGQATISSTDTYCGTLSVGLDIDDKSIVKSTLNGVLIAILPSTPANQMISKAGIAASAIKKAFAHLDKDDASQS